MKLYELARPVTAKPDVVRSLALYGLLVPTKVALARKPKPVSPIEYCHANSSPRTSADGPLTREVTLNCAGAPLGRVTLLIVCVIVPPTMKLVTSFTKASTDT